MVFNTLTVKLFKKLTLLQKRHPRKCFTDCKFKPPWNILFFGTDEFSIFSLRAILAEYRKGELIGKLEVCTSFNKVKNAVHSFAEAENLKLNEWPFEVVKNEFHTGLVVSFGHLIPKKVIEKFPLGMINVHASLLPRWRGAAPIIYSLANGDTITGISIMKIKPKKFDTGEIISQHSMEISNDTYMPELHSKLGVLGANALVECLRDLPNKINNAKPQPQEDVTMAPKVNTTFACIDWKTMTSTQIYNRERALRGFMPVTSMWRGETIKLFNIHLIEDVFDNVIAEEGSIIYDDSLNVLKVLCSDKKYISIEKVQVFKKKVMSAKDFNNGYLKKTPLDKRYFT